MPLRQITMYVNSDTGKIVSGTGSVVSANEAPSVYLDEKVILCIQFINTLGYVVPFQEAEAFELAMDNNYNHTDYLMSYSDNSMFNVVGDWVDETPWLSDDGNTPTTDWYKRGSNKSRGRLSVRLYCNTANFDEKIGTSVSSFGYIEIKKFNMGRGSIICQSKITCRNIINKDGGTPYEPLILYYKAAQCDSLFTRINDFNLSGVVESSVASNAFTISSCVCKLNIVEDTVINTINGGSEAYCLLLFHSTTYLVTLKHNVGNILLPESLDLDLQINQIYMLYFDGTYWRVNK